MVNVMEKLIPKQYVTKIMVEYNKEDGYEPSYYITIPEELVDELGWDEHTSLSYSLKMGVSSNVVVIQKNNS